MHDLAGLKINHIQVLRAVPNRKGYWRYRCQCGKEKSARADVIRTGRQKSCGCRRMQNKFTDITGQKFGKLTAQWPVGRKGRNLRGRVFWLASCECGKLLITEGKSLRLGLTKTCGCSSYDYIRTHGQTGSGKYRILCSSKSRAKKLGLPFNLTLEDINIPEFCPILGIKLEFNKGLGPKSNSPTLDRMIPSIGYVKGNVAIISHRANQIKNDASLEELKKLVNWMEMLR